MPYWMTLAFTRYADFHGRSRRKEYWGFFLLQVVVIGLLVWLRIATDFDGELAAASASKDDLAEMRALLGGTGVLLGLWVLVTLVPGLAVAVRRLHDTDRSGWYYLTTAIPYVGTFLFVMWMCEDGTRGPNRFGASSKYPDEMEIFG